MIGPNVSYTTGASAPNVSVSWTKRIRRRHAPTCGGWWGVADAVVHALKVPRWLARPVCDHYDIAVGIPKADLIKMDYKGKPPWWLR